MTQSLKTLELVVRAADDRLAQDIVAMDVRNLTPVADYFVVTHAKNDKQLDAIVDSITDAAHQAGVTVKNVEGKDGGKWILIDLVDVIVHVFYYAEREHYNLEKLWKDAPFVDIHEWVSEQ
ncbi:ribosome silencing factor [Aerococcaceae bacterium NML191292]|nr:ribosome silencing factor [Aerococcaceae bacterium NML210727]MCW6654597.1 ribosome silencing factor [Aerococcaceae bacterium NML201296]MCW6659218.1 ribosome silencing factor [Aerococcaceae bacterium NML191292]MCW6661270.1 ribosome silencing factor [Aerococcaceae bacterium NML201209]MCW6662549.1 ribosome silencing factor [Aerococcaceae bacterium NML190073]MCW6664599.1 ribosome silencing factor [Aerococcaceae bacterium NML191219]MCW6666031.1 ribosome silencing factor [Aerococcaceae bacterium